MTTARAHLVKSAVTRSYHCITRSVRRAFLLSEVSVNRQEWIELRLEELASVFAVDVGWFSMRAHHRFEPGKRRNR